jgi:uncharacterized protein YndB with AHSA1/START domain
MSSAIHQEIVIQSSPAKVYAALTDATQFGKMSGAPAEIDANAGGVFSCFGGMIEGRNIECVPGERLVQAWRVKMWEAGAYSIVRFALRAEGKSTRIVMDHDGFPAEQREHLDKGWHANYWDNLRKTLE